MRRWRTVHRDAHAAPFVNRDGKFRLHAGERHRDPLLPGEEWLGRQFLDESLKVLWILRWPPLNGGCSSGLPDGERAGGVSADCREEADHVVARHSQKLTERSQLLAFRQQICGPWKKSIGSDPFRLQGHRHRNGKCTSQVDPLGIIGEAWTV